MVMRGKARGMPQDGGPGLFGCFRQGAPFDLPLIFLGIDAADSLRALDDPLISVEFSVKDLLIATSQKHWWD
jgi:hypothetical protein